MSTRYFKDSVYPRRSEWKVEGDKVQHRFESENWDDSICDLSDLLIDSSITETDEHGDPLTTETP